MGCGPSKPSRRRPRPRSKGKRRADRPSPGEGHAGGEHGDEEERGRPRRARATLFEDLPPPTHHSLAIPRIETRAPSSSSREWEPTHGFTGGRTEPKLLPRSDDLAQQYSIHKGRAQRSGAGHGSSSRR